MDGEWRDATLGPAGGEFAWRPWSFEWDATVGDHELSCRATDAAGEHPAARPAMELPGSRQQLGAALQRHRSLTDSAHEASVRRTDSALRAGRECLFAHDVVSPSPSRAADCARRISLGRRVGQPKRVRSSRQPNRSRAGSGRGGHQGRRAERRDRLLDVLPVARLRQVHQGHDRPLRGDLSGRHGQVGRPPGHLPGRPQQRVLRRTSRRTSSTCRSARAGSATTRPRACSSASTAPSRRRSRTSTSRASGTSSWSRARTSSSRGTRASTSS